MLIASLSNNLVCIFVIICRMLHLVAKVFHFCFYVSLCLSCSEAMVNIPKNDSILNILAFGDSFLDTGNNNYIPAVLKANFPPYGKDFLGGKPSGRFSNGKIISDYIVEKLGVKDYLPAYLDPSIKDTDLLSGVSFASAGCGYDPITSVPVNVIPLSGQLEMFKEYIGRLHRIVGEEATNHVIGESVYLVSSSSNDWAISYTVVPVRRLQYNVHDYANLLVKNAINFTQELYKLGAKRIVFWGTPYIGCFPLARTISSGHRNCGKMFNEEAQTFNNMLQHEIEVFRRSLPQSKICYVDYFKITQDIIENPLQYGLEVVDRACCGTGAFEVSFLCNKLSPICPDDSKFLFWDSVHLTDKAYKMVVDQALPYFKECLL